MEKMRLDRYFSSQEICSRREIKDALRKGLVTVNGQVVKQADCKVEPAADVITLNGRVVGFEPYVYYMLNKPAGVVSATEDKRLKTVLDLVPPELYRSDLFPAGRLDRDTTGFVLLTNDGDFAHRILAPKSHVEKTYHAESERKISAEDIEAFAAGITLSSGERCLPAKLRVLEEYASCGDGKAACLCEVIICEGKYHQIKKMFEARGSRVVSLRRVRMGGLWLDERLKEGECRPLTDEEREKIADVTGETC